MYESGHTGDGLAISVNGKQVWQHGFGYSDLEDKQLVGTGCHENRQHQQTPDHGGPGQAKEVGVDLDSAVPGTCRSGRRRRWRWRCPLTVWQLCCHGRVRHYDRKGSRPASRSSKKEYYNQEHFSSTVRAWSCSRTTSCCTPGHQVLNYTPDLRSAKVIENVTGQPFRQTDFGGQFRDRGWPTLISTGPSPSSPTGPATTPGQSTTDCGTLPTWTPGTSGPAAAPFQCRRPHQVRLGHAIQQLPMEVRTDQAKTSNNFFCPSCHCSIPPPVPSLLLLHSSHEGPGPSVPADKDSLCTCRPESPLYLQTRPPLYLQNRPLCHHLQTRPPLPVAQAP